MDFWLQVAPHHPSGILTGTTNQEEFRSSHHASVIGKPGHSLTDERHATSSHRQDAVASHASLLAGHG